MAGYEDEGASDCSTLGVRHREGMYFTSLIQSLKDY
jgi:hypothetical protein